MATLLLKLKGIRSLNRTFFPPRLFVYDDLLVYRKGKLLGRREITIAYNHIVQVNLNKGLILSHLEIINTGAEDIKVKWILNGPAQKAKQIIDQKVYHVHRKGGEGNITTLKEDVGDTYHSLEKSLNRLRELVQRGKISEREYRRKRKNLLKKLG